MGDGIRWLGGRYIVAIYFLSTVKVSCVDCIRIRSDLPRSFKKDENSIIPRMYC